MNIYSTCPACAKSISPDRQIGQTLICDCGWSGTTEKRTLEDQGLKFDSSSILIICFAFILTAGFVHSINWDKHFFAIIPLKAAQWTGAADIADLEKIAKICHDRKKYSCEADAYAQLFEMDPTQVNYLHQLGKLQTSLEDFTPAIKTYKTYFKQGGDKIEAHYQYAKALGSNNLVKEATKHYQKVLNSKPGTLQITVTRSFVQMLTKNKEWKQAKRVINYWRTKGTNTSLFLNNEMNIIKQNLNGRVISSE